LPEDRRERPEALLPTMADKPPSNVGWTLQRDGVLDRYGVELIGANERPIRLAETDRISQAMRRIGLATPQRDRADSEEAYAAVAGGGVSAILRPSFTLGARGGIAYNQPSSRP